MARVDMSAGRCYSPRGAFRTGVLVLSSGQYQTSWGLSVADGPHMRFDEPDLSKREQFPFYACKLQDFLRDYGDVSPVLYRKKVSVLAVLLTEDAVVTTQEGEEMAPAGSYVLQDSVGNQWPMSAQTFHRTYMEA